MSKPEWGAKRSCLNCGARFYDLRKKPIICPKCETTHTPEDFQARRRPRAAAAESKPVEIKKAPAPEKAVEAEDPPESEEEEVDEELTEIEEDSEDEVIEDTSDLGEDDDDMAEVLEHTEADDKE